MTTDVFHTNFEAPLTKRDFDTGFSLLPPAIQNKILRFHRWQDRTVSLLGKLLLIHALKIAGIDRQLSSLKYSEFDRPCFENGPDFNISHSGSRIVCAIASEGSVGIDIEKVEPIPVEEFEQNFTADEWKIIRTAEDVQRTFYQFWTRKEAILKADGKGLNIPLQSFEVIDDEVVLDSLADPPGLSQQSNRWHLHHLEINDDYLAYLACQNASPDITMEAISPADLILSTSTK